MTDDAIAQENAGFDWAAIRADYEDSGMTVVAILKKYKLSKTRFYDEAKINGWHPRQTFDRLGRRGVIARMKALLEKQLTHLEANMDGASEKEIALLGTMTRTLEKLIELDTKTRTDKDKPKRPNRELQALRKKLAARIDALEEK